MQFSFEKLRNIFQDKKKRNLIGASSFLVIFILSLSLEQSQSPKSSTPDSFLPKNKVQYASLDNNLELDFHHDINQKLNLELAEKDAEIKSLKKLHLKSEKKISDLEEKSNQILATIEAVAKQQYIDENYSLPHPKQHSKKKMISSMQVSSIEKPKKRTTSNYIPAGTFIKAKILGGVDVSTNPEAKRNPQPMLLHVTDWANLPSLEKQDISHCRITAHAWGDLSSERAYARTENLSCVKKNGDIIDTKIQAFLVDETSKNGIRGDVVARHEGSMITQAFLSKFIGSIGGGVADFGNNFGSSQENISWKDATKSAGIRAAGSGIKGAGDTLERYFVERLNELSPVIQVFADKDVHVVLTKGVELGKDSKSKEKNYNID